MHIVWTFFQDNWNWLVMSVVTALLLQRLRRRGIAEASCPAPSFQIAPMLDVIFVIMLFFLVMAGAIRQERQLSMRLPGIVSSVHDLPLEVEIGIGEDGAVLINDEVSDTALDQGLIETRRVLTRVAQVARETASPVLILVNAANDASYGRVIEVLDAVSFAGLHDVTIAVGGL